MLGGLAAALIVVISLAVVSRNDGGDKEQNFRAWEAEHAQTSPDAGLLVPSSGFKPAADSKADPNRQAPAGAPRDEPTAPRRTYQQGNVAEDTLNRPGPAGDDLPWDVPADLDPRDMLDKDAIRDGIDAVRPIVKVCYEETLAEFPDAAGKVTLSFRIAAEDDVGRVELSELDEEKTSLFDEKLHDCMMESIAEASFPAPGGGGVVNVTYPFVFESDAEPE